MLLCRADRQPDPDKLSDDGLGASPTLLCPYGNAVWNNESMDGKVLEIHMKERRTISRHYVESQGYSRYQTGDTSELHILFPLIDFPS